MEAGFLAEKEVHMVRPLWEEVFAEDSKKFTDYYFEHKAESNLVFTRMDGGKIVSMLHLTPYLSNKNESICYIVGVATKAEYRRQGLMDSLMTEALQFMWEEGQPFTFLMPANPAYYTPYNFTYIYNKSEWKLNEEHLPAKYLDAASANEAAFQLLVKDVGTLRLRAVKDNDLKDVAEFANAFLKENADCYMLRNAHYYKIMKQELLAQNGNLFVAEQDGDIKGILSYVNENGRPGLQEVLLSQDLDDYRLVNAEAYKPSIMGRIVHAEAFLNSMSGLGRMDFKLQIKDERIAENNAIYKIHCGSGGGELSCKKLENTTSSKESAKCEENVRAVSDADCSITIEKLTAFCFGEKEAEECFEVLDDIRKADILKELRLIKQWKSIFINEIV